jgi:hypothetical protein
MTEILTRDRILTEPAERKRLINTLRSRWQQVARSTQPIDQATVQDLIHRIYDYFDYPEPTIHYVVSPYGDWQGVPNKRARGPLLPLNELPRLLRESLESQFLTQKLPIHEFLEEPRPKGNSFEPTHVKDLYWSSTTRSVERDFMLVRGLRQSLPSSRQPQGIVPQEWISDAGWLTFWIEHLGYSHDPEIWKIYQAVALNCSWIFPGANVCIICDRPTEMHLDEHDRLHCQDFPAVTYADGTKLYFYHGLRLPKYMAGLPTSAWKSEWITTEENLEIRRILMHGIGHTRLYQELDGTEIDTWREYTLLRIGAAAINRLIDVEPIHLVKMTCPSTGHIHVIRVPRFCPTAREAMRWVNGGIDPEDFAQET